MSASLRAWGAAAVALRAASAAPSFLVLHPDDFYPHYGDWGVAPSSPPGFNAGPPVPVAALPNIERLRSEGATFTRVVVSASKCSPSRYSDLTGRYPSRNSNGRAASGANAAATDVHERSCRLDGVDGAATLPRYLSSCGGYRSALVGKYHLAMPDAPSNGNADYAAAAADAAAVVGAEVSGFYYGNLENKDSRNRQQDGSTPNHNLEWVVEKGLEFLADAGDDPYYLYWNPTLVHKPSVDALLNPAHAYFGVGHNSVLSTPAGDLEAPPDVGRFCAGCAMPDRADVWAAMEASGVEYRDPALAAAVIWIDSAVGAFLGYLDAIGADPYVLFTSDHGALKDSVHDLGTRTFLFIRGPGIAPNSVNAGLVSNADYAPTFLDLAGLDGRAYDADGASFARALLSGAQAGPTAVYSEFYSDRAVYLADGASFWKLLRAVGKKYQRAMGGDYYPHDGESLQLYDLVNDPAEQTNLVATADAALLADLVARLDAHDAREDTPAAPPTACGADRNATAWPTAAPVPTAWPPAPTAATVAGGEPTAAAAAAAADDACQYANDGECDEPRYCDYGTDNTDCAAVAAADGADASPRKRAATAAPTARGAKKSTSSGNSSQRLVIVAVFAVVAAVIVAGATVALARTRGTDACLLSAKETGGFSAVAAPEPQQAALAKPDAPPEAELTNLESADVNI